MDGHRTFIMPSNEETEINLKTTTNNKAITFEVPNNNIDNDTQLCKTNENRLQEEPRGNFQHNVLSYSNISFCNLLEDNVSAGVGDKISYEMPLTSKGFEQQFLNVAVEDISSKNMICNNIVKLNWDLLKKSRQSELMQLSESIKENDVGTVSVCGPTLIKLLANNKKGYNDYYYNTFDQNLDSNIPLKKFIFDRNSSKATINIQLTNKHCLPLYNLAESFTNSYQMLSNCVKLDNSREVVQFVLPFQFKVFASQESRIGELIKKSSKRESYINHGLFGEQKCFNQLSSKEHNMVAVSKESNAKYTRNSDTENILLIPNTNKLLVYPEMYIELKEKPNISLNQINSFGFKLFEKNYEHVITENDFSNSAECLPIQQYTTSNNLKLGSNCNKSSNSIFAQYDFSKHLHISSNEVNLQRKLMESSNFKSNKLINTETNLSLVETSCTVNLFNQLSENMLHEQSAKHTQALMNHKLLLSDTMITNSTAINDYPFSTLSKYIEIDKATISSFHSENIDKILIHSDNTQSPSGEVINNTSMNDLGASENVSNQIFKLEPSTGCKLLGQTTLKLITNSVPQKVNLESWKADVSTDCTLQRYKYSITNQNIVQYPIPSTEENVLESKVLSHGNNNFYIQPSLKRGNEFDDNSFIQSEINENILRSPSKGNTSIDANKRLKSEQKLFEMLPITNMFVHSEPCKQLLEQTYSYQLSQLLEGESKHLSSQTVPKKPSINTKELSTGISKLNDLSREAALVCSNMKPYDVLEKVELSDGFSCNKLCKVELSISFSSDKLTSNTTSSNETIVDKTIQFDGETLDVVDFDADIDKAIDESMNKYESFLCDKEVLATPDTSDKSSQTDKIIIKEGQLSCKRCLTFDGEDFNPSKRIKVYNKNNKDSNLLNCEQVKNNSLTEELMSSGFKSYSSSNPTSINDNGSTRSTRKFSNFIDGLTITNNNMLQTNLKDFSPTISQDMKIYFNRETLFCKESNMNDEFSLYDEDTVVKDGFNWLKDSKEKCEGESVLSDHQVPVVNEADVARTASIIKNPSSFTTPKKPILKVGLSRSARLKPLHQK